MSDESLPRSGNPQGIFALPGWVWDQLCDLVAQNRVEPSAGITVSRTKNGTFVRLTAPPQIQQLKITGNESGGGWYKARTIIGTTTPASGTVTVSMPLTGETVANADDALVAFLAENGVNSHILPNPSYGVGFLFGITRETTPRKVFIWLSGAPIGVYPCTCVTNSGSFGDASNRATLTYNITPYGGAATVGANLAPKMSPARIYKEAVTAGTDGEYAYNGTQVVLMWVNELADSELC